MTGRVALTPTAVCIALAAYRAGEALSDVARRFGVHRTEILRREREDRNLYFSAVAAKAVTL